jgi:hypothetical protein
LHDVRVQFAGGISQTWRDVAVPSGPGEELTFYMRMLPWHEGPFQWPPATAPYAGASTVAGPVAPPATISR